MAEENGHPPGLTSLLNRLASTGVEMLHNRGELFAVELQEEKGRSAQLLCLASLMLLSAFIGLVMLSLLIIFLFRPEWRPWAALGFVVLYFAGAVWAGLAMRSVLRRAPFSESLRQLRKDRQWLESLK